MGYRGRKDGKEKKKEASWPGRTNQEGTVKSHNSLMGWQKQNAQFSHPVILAMETIPSESGENKLPYVTSYMANTAGPE